MRHDELYVADLVDGTRAIREYLDGVSREHWDEDRVLRDAVLYRLLLLGENRERAPGCPARPRHPVASRHVRGSPDRVLKGKHHGPFGERFQ
jgi:uncharacterized protein with HEPN domain